MLLEYLKLAGAFLPFLILPGTLISAENINFYNVRPPLDPTPFPNSFKCFTCDNAEDNYNCNRWAEDRWCPESTRYCLTVHLFTEQGKSTSVTKKCATGEECHFVGCHHHRESGHTVSTSLGVGAAHWAWSLHFCTGFSCWAEGGCAKTQLSRLPTPSLTAEEECVSCCEGMICNVGIPTNDTNAVFAVLHARRTSGGSRPVVSVAVLLVPVVLALS